VLRPFEGSEFSWRALRFKSVSSSSWILGADGECSQSISLASFNVPSSRHASPSGLDASLKQEAVPPPILEEDAVAPAAKFRVVWIWISIKKK
jgi:hypothetical protein